MVEIIDKELILKKIGAFVKEKAIMYAPVDKGFLRQGSNFTIEVVGDEVTITCTSPYADYVEYGTGVFHISPDGLPDPHKGWDIVPINKKALKFEVDSEVIFAKKVHIEGMRPHPFLRPAVYNHLPEIEAIIASGFK